MGIKWGKMKTILLILFCSSMAQAVQTVVPTTCYVRKEFMFVATTVSVQVASSLADVNCWIISNKDGTNSLIGSINASTGTGTSNGFEIMPNTVWQLYTGPYNTLYIRSSASSVNADILSGRTTP